MPPKSSFCAVAALSAAMCFVWYWCIGGCTYQQPGRVPACPVVPILNTCQQKLSSPTCFKHQTCNYEVFQKAHFKLLGCSNIPQTEMIWTRMGTKCIRKAAMSLSRAPTMFCEPLSGLPQPADKKWARSGARCAAHSLVGMSNGCKAQQRPDKRPRRPGAFIARPARVAPISCPPSRLIAPRLFSPSFAGIPTIHEENTRGMF